MELKMEQNAYDHLTTKMLSINSIAKLPVAALSKTLEDQFHSLVLQALEIEKQLPYLKLMEKLPFQFDYDCTAMANDLESAVSKLDWYRVWYLSDALLDHLGLRRVIPEIKGLEKLRSMKAKVEVVRAWLLLHFNLAEEKLRPTPEDATPDWNLKKSNQEPLRSFSEILHFYREMNHRKITGSSGPESDK